MSRRICASLAGVAVIGVVFLSGGLIAGCQGDSPTTVRHGGLTLRPGDDGGLTPREDEVTADEIAVREAVERYAGRQADLLAVADTSVTAMSVTDMSAANLRAAALAQHVSRGLAGREGAFDGTVPMLGTFAVDGPATSGPSSSPSSAPSGAARSTATASAAFVPPDGYWRQDIWHQMGNEALSLGKHDFWRGFKTSFWDLPNALVLTATMGASITIRETDVDDTIRNHTRGHRQLGDSDEAIQILGNPGTHFAAAGALWLGSALTRDMKQHEVAQSLTQALAVNGVTTMLLKVATNTRTPDNEHFGWPSGHTSSAFTAAAVLNEYYGPWIGVPSLALAGLVGYQRLDSRVHDFSDVVFGGMLGYIIGSSIARDGKAEFPEIWGMQVIPYMDPETQSSGLVLRKQW